MNTLPYLNAHRLNRLFFLAGLLLLVLLGQQRLALLQNLFDRLAERPTIVQARSPQAGPPALLLLEADALVLPMTNGSTPLTARLRDAEGNPVAGVQMQFQSNLGSINPASATTDASGVASVTFQASGTAGQARVIAKTSELSRDAAIQLVNPTTNAASNVLTLDFAAGQLNPGQEVAISAVLRDAAGQPVVGELVTLFGSLGEVTPASAMSDASGRVTATYHAGQNAGPAMITALAGVAAQSVSFQVDGSGVPGQSASKAFLPVVRR